MQVLILVPLHPRRRQLQTVWLSEFDRPEQLEQDDKGGCFDLMVSADSQGIVGLSTSRLGPFHRGPDLSLQYFSL